MTVVDVAIALVCRGGRIFLQRRDPAGAVLAGGWEFPGGKVEPGESPEQALRRELHEEVGLEPASLHAFSAYEYAYPDHRVRLHSFLVEVAGNPHTSLAWGWFTTAEAERLPLPEANRPLLRGLAEVAGGATDAGVSVQSDSLGRPSGPEIS